MKKTPFKGLTGSDMEAVANRFRALSEVSRLIIIHALHSGEKSVTELVDLTGLSQPNVSRHLAVLTAAGLIGRRKQGLHVIYKIVDNSLDEICSIVCKSVVRR